MIDDTLFNLIQESLKVKNKIENEEVEVDENQEISVDNEELLNFNKELLEGLLNQLKEKDR